MGGFDFDRQPFARPAAAEPKPRSSSSIPGALIALVLVALGGFVAYQFLNVGAHPRADEDAAALQQINKRLNALEHRVDEMQPVRRTFRVKPSAARIGLEESEDSAPRQTSHHAALASGSLPLLYSSPVVFVPTPSKSGISSKSLANKDPGNQRTIQPLANTNAAAQQEWEATANRLGDIVGELATQRGEIDQTQANVGRLSEQLMQSNTPFTLERGARPQRLGPVRLKLDKTDVRNQRYTITLFMGDRSIELKNRALNESLQFYTPEGSAPFDLVVSEIRKDSVVGRLSTSAVPAAH